MDTFNLIGFTVSCIAGFSNFLLGISFLSTNPLLGMVLMIAIYPWICTGYYKYINE